MSDRDSSKIVEHVRRVGFVALSTSLALAWSAVTFERRATPEEYARAQVGLLSGLSWNAGFGFDLNLVLDSVAEALASTPQDVWINQNPPDMAEFAPAWLVVSTPQAAFFSRSFVGGSEESLGSLGQIRTAWDALRALDVVLPVAPSGEALLQRDGQTATFAVSPPPASGVAAPRVPDAAGSWVEDPPPWAVDVVPSASRFLTASGQGFDVVVPFETETQSLNLLERVFKDIRPNSLVELSFDEAFPATQALSPDLWEMDWATLESAIESLIPASVQAEIQRLQDGDEASLEVFGVDFSRWSLLRWGAGLLLVIELYLALHLSGLRSALKEGDPGLDMPWLGLYPSHFAIVVLVVAVSVVPVFAIWAAQIRLAAALPVFTTLDSVYAFFLAVSSVVAAVFCAGNSIAIWRCNRTWRAKL